MDSAHLNFPEGDSSEDPNIVQHLSTDNPTELTSVVLVVQGKKIIVKRQSLALVSKFFRALFSHEFHDSRAPVLYLDTKGEMGLTTTAVEVLAEFARSRQLSLDRNSAIQVFIAADALDVEDARVTVENFLGTKMLRQHRETFLNFWKMSRQFHMKILESLLEGFCLENFGWFSCTLPLFSAQYLAGWERGKLSRFLLNEKFSNCSEEQIFRAVVSYCQTRGGQEGWEELAPGLYRSCGAYLRYIQSVPRMLPFKLARR